MVRFLEKPKNLCAPLLARMLADGHSTAAGVLATTSAPFRPVIWQVLKPAKTRLKIPTFAEYYDHMSSIVHDPLWSGERLKNIVSMNCGKHDDLIYKGIIRADSFSFVTGITNHVANSHGEYVYTALEGRDKEERLCNGNDLHPEQGKYRATFRLKSSATGSNPAARLMVEWHHSKGKTVELLLTGSDFDSSDSRQRFELPFEIKAKRNSDFECKVIFLEHGELSFDQVTISRQ